MRIWIVIFILISLLPIHAHAERIQLKSGRIFEADIIEEGEDYIDIAFYGSRLKFYRHEIVKIGDEVPVIEQGALIRTLYKIYRDSQSALDREDKAAYKSMLSYRKAYMVESESDSFFESLKLLKRFGMNPTAPKVPEHVAEYQDQKIQTAVLYLSDPLKQRADGYFSFSKSKEDVPVLRLTFVRQNNGWKIDEQENLTKPSWMSYPLFETARRKTVFDVPKEWKVRYSDDSDENQFKYSDVSALEFSDDGQHLYVNITFDEKWPKENLDFSIYFNMDSTDLNWVTSHDHFDRQIVGWQYQLRVSPSPLGKKNQPLSYSVFYRDSESTQEVYFEQMNGWILDKGEQLLLKVPVELLELDRNNSFKFAIVDS